MGLCPVRIDQYWSIDQIRCEFYQSNEYRRHSNICTIKDSVRACRIRHRSTFWSPSNPRWVPDGGISLEFQSGCNQKAMFRGNDQPNALMDSSLKLFGTPGIYGWSEVSVVVSISSSGVVEAIKWKIPASAYSTDEAIKCEQSARRP